MKQQLHAGADAAFGRAGALGIAVLVALAVAREGAETAIFLYGLSFNAGSELWLGAALGVVLALLTAAVLARGLRLFSHAVFFRASSALLLLLACGLLVAGVEQLIGLELLPALVDPLWDSAFLLDDAAGIGHVLATFAGYRARPSLLLLLLVAAYWLFVLWPRRPAWETVPVHG